MRLIDDSSVPWVLLCVFVWQACPGFWTLCWRSSVLKVICVDGRLCWRSSVLKVICVEGRLCWRSSVLKVVCVEGRLCWRSSVLHEIQTVLSCLPFMIKLVSDIPGVVWSLVYHAEKDNEHLRKTPKICITGPLCVSLCCVCVRGGGSDPLVISKQTFHLISLIESIKTTSIGRC